ncbi:hypothetical protein GX50_06333 [[Emmonsia] crescens]|uniref:Uncharacterized protein n=1 Tax=[Emmonsia] crescens TaxID=73230 RepID=A0A2B7ZCE6_9EURO|nr:hypothetical protein GX50_06333 [Emmonsia crescens]
MSYAIHACISVKGQRDVRSQSILAKTPQHPYIALDSTKMLGLVGDEDEDGGGSGGGGD